MSSAFKIAVVGSGPAGLSAAGRAAQLGLSHVLLEKTDHLSDTIYKYQKGKHVMATPSQLVLRSDMDFDAGKREAMLGTWDTAGGGAEGQRPAQRRGQGDHRPEGRFHAHPDQRRRVKAEYVILGVGTQGNPNKMRCPGGDLPHIQYQLDDPGEYVDEHITVIGSGDAGIENALGLAADPAQGNTVTILNRSAEFARAKQANVDLLERGGQERAASTSCARPRRPRSRPGWLTLETRDGEQKIRCDRIIARMGSSPPRKFVEDCGIAFSSEDTRRLSLAVAAIRDHGARHLRDRRAGRLSADQALHEPGL